MLQKFSIRSQILITFAVLATISLLVVSSISLANVNRVGELTEEQASNALNDQIKRNIQLSSSENADIIEKKFRNAEANLNKIGEAAESVFSGELEFDPVASYHESELQSIPDVRDDPRYGEFISPTTSTYYYPDAALVSGELTAAANETIELSAHVDTVFASIFERNPEYVWMYVSFSPARGEIFRNFPGALVDPAGEYRPSTQEDYYIDAVDALGEIVYTSPYFDLTQGLVVTLSKAIYVQGSLLGVVGIDFKTTVIQNKVLDVNFLESGYASLIETDTETVIAHPNWDSENHDEEDPIPTFTELETGIASQTISEITSGDQDVTTYTDDNQAYFLAYAPILADDAGDSEFIFMIHVLASEVLSPVDQIQSRIETSVGNISASVLLLSIITLIGTLAVGLWIAGSITKPVSRLTKIARQITMNATKEDIFDGVEFGDTLESEDEIGDLSRSFQSMVGQLREEQRQKSQKK